MVTITYEKSMSLKDAMVKKGWTRQVVAKKIGVSESNVGNWLNGKWKPHKPNQKKLNELFYAEITFPTSDNPKTMPTIKPSSADEVALMEGMSDGRVKLRIEKVMCPQHAMEVWTLLFQGDQ